MKRYAGIGSRETPVFVLSLMMDIAGTLAQKGWILRSGGARGADSAFASGATQYGGPMEIYRAEDNIPAEAFKMAQEVHPAWEKCSEYAKRLHGRNVMQILGQDLKTPVNFVVCWTKDGKPSGGTATAMRIAMNRNIPVFNLKFEHIKKQFKNLKIS